MPLAFLDRISRRHLVLAGVVLLACLFAVVLHPFLREETVSADRPVDLDEKVRTAVLAAARGQRIHPEPSVFCEGVPTGKPARRRLVFAGRKTHSDRPSSLALFVANVKVGKKGQIYNIDGPFVIAEPKGASIETVIRTDGRLAYTARAGEVITQVGVIDWLGGSQDGVSAAQRAARKGVAKVFELQIPASKVRLSWRGNGVLNVTTPKRSGQISKALISSVDWLTALEVSDTVVATVTGQKSGTEDGEGTQAPEPDSGLVFEAIPLDADAGVTADAAHPKAADAGLIPEDATPLVADAGVETGDSSTDGGATDGGQATKAVAVREGWSNRTPSAAPLSAPRPLVPLVADAPEGEGVWVPRTADGSKGSSTAFYRTFWRPNPGVPARATVVLMDPRWLELKMVGGTDYPLSPIARDGRVPKHDRAHTVAAFNGFYDADAGELGMVVSRRLITTMRSDRYTISVGKEGGIAMGAWPRGGLPLSVDSARQTRPPLVLDGRVRLGRGIANQARSWRSALGVTKAGYLIYVVCAGCDARELGRVLLAADTDRATQLTDDQKTAGFEFWKARGTFIQTTSLLPDSWKRSRYTWARRSDFFYLMPRPRLNERADAINFDTPLTPVADFEGVERGKHHGMSVVVFRGRSTRFVDARDDRAVPGCVLTIQMPPVARIDRAMRGFVDTDGLFKVEPAGLSDIEWRYRATARYNRWTGTAQTGGWALGSDTRGNLWLVGGATAKAAAQLITDLGARHAIDPVGTGSAPRLACGQQVLLDGPIGPSPLNINVYAVRHPNDWRPAVRITDGL